MEEKETKENEESEKVSKTKPSMFGGQKLIRIEFAIIGAVLLLAAGLVVGSNMFPNSTTEIIISNETVNESIDMGELSIKVLDYVTKNLVPDNVTATVTDISEAGDSLYAVSINLTSDGQTQPVIGYITGNGDRIVFGQAFDPAVNLEKPEPKPEPVIELQKSDKPEVELFVMSHCPFGTQMEKGILPVVEALGDKINFDLKFVHYVMHGETEVMEQLNQYCIQRDQEEKFTDYLKCFLKEGDGETCLAENEIDTEALSVCTSEVDEQFEITVNLEDRSLWLNDKYPLFNTSAEKNTEYGVGGSPTLVINGTIVKSERDSASLLNAICGAFNEQPEECATDLPSEAFSIGFGYEEVVGATAPADATCG